MNPELMAALAQAKDKTSEIERQFGPRRELSPYTTPQQTEEQQQEALAEMEAMKQQLQVWLFSPQLDITVQELALILSMLVPQVPVNPAGQTLEQRLGTAARHFVLKG